MQTISLVSQPLTIPAPVPLDDLRNLEPNIVQPLTQESLLFILLLLPICITTL